MAIGTTASIEGYGIPIRQREHLGDGVVDKILQFIRWVTTAAAATLPRIDGVRDG